MQEVVFEIGSQSISAITNSSGFVMIQVSLPQEKGKHYRIFASFSGDEDYLPSCDSQSFEILK
jgi:hypothetical protein